ncbi:MAG: hypothetical protein V4595_08725 [Pseudomonadota bacterium]|jgi:hypothetical protein
MNDRKRARTLDGNARHQALHPDIVEIGGIIAPPVCHRPATELAFGDPFVVEQDDVVMAIVLYDPPDRRLHTQRRPLERLQEMHPSDQSRPVMPSIALLWQDCSRIVGRLPRSPCTVLELR